ncbi:tannase and feruloyl esterase [Zopfia rhizophila CBS 207.26]|uniref:Carboxylic ester hydrolase n=1 Tax=Zopfia rhizophila CBS 207.26 TaxID=1314779 RepID=A0A6A6DNN0_9PEZI|nr:tannase and feruloyl esterase [Zopfia rhizophila CBS 207.26]
MAFFYQNLSAISIPYPSVSGAEILSLDAKLVSTFSTHVHERYYINHASLNVQNASFCNVTVTYTHPGYNDTIHTQVWLPIGTWNEQMRGIGGSRWTAGIYNCWYIGDASIPQYAMMGAIREGYAAVTTNAGHMSTNPDDWLLMSPGNVNLTLLQDLGSVSLNEAAIVGKDITRRFYGQQPKFSYFSSCSQGGRQVTAYYWPSFIMNKMGKHPYPCKLDAITTAAIGACAGFDGVKNGMVTDPRFCDFDPWAVVGTTIDCSDTRAQSTSVRSCGDRGKYVMGRAALVSWSVTLVCVPFSLATDWIRLSVKKDPTFDASNMTHEEYNAIFPLSAQELTSIPNSDNLDLSAFRQAGGKMLSFHGLADSIIPPEQIQNYYELATSLDPDYCYGGAGVYQSGIFDAMVAWVENGTVPECLNATTSPSSANDTVKQRLLCPYPQVAKCSGVGDTLVASSFRCAP